MIGALLASLALSATQPPPPVSDSQPEPVINTGAGLLENCTYDAKAAGQADLEFHLGLCIGFIKGVTNAWAEQSTGEFCPPDELDNEELRAVIVNWLRSHPEALDASAVGSVLSATTEAFPCDAKVNVDESSHDASA